VGPDQLVVLATLRQPTPAVAPADRRRRWQLLAAFPERPLHVPPPLRARHQHLETTFTCDAGVAVAYDFMAVPADDHGSQLVRIVEVRSGDVPFRMVLRASPGSSPARRDCGPLLAPW